MAIQFARIEIISRNKGRNALQKAAYNARQKVTLERNLLIKAAYNARQKISKNGKIYNFSNKRDCEYHEILLPEHVKKKFLDVETFMTEVESSEKRKDAQLLKEIVIALPKEKEIRLKNRVEISHEFIKKMGWIKEGLGVQLNLHKPHEKKDKNYHAHILVTTRRFNKSGDGLSSKKARDLNPEFKSAKGKNFIVREEEMISKIYREVQENYFRERGLEIEVDKISRTPQKHLGPRRFRTREGEKVRALNEAKSKKNEISLRQEPLAVVETICKRQLVFCKKDVEYFMKKQGVHGVQREKFVERVFKLKDVLGLRYYINDRKWYETGQYVLKSAWEQVERGMRNAEKIRSKKMKKISYLEMGIETSCKSFQLNEDQREIVKKIASDSGGLRVIRGVAGSGKSRILGAINDVFVHKIDVIGIAPTNKAVNELREKNFEKVDTVSGFLWKLERGGAPLTKGGLVILDEASMVSNNNYDRLLSLCLKKGFSLIICGDEKQLGSIERGGIFDRIISVFDSLKLDRIVRQKEYEDITVARNLADGEMEIAIDNLYSRGKLDWQDTREESVKELLSDWRKSNISMDQRIIIAVSNKEVDRFNQETHRMIFENSVGKRVILHKERGGRTFEQEFFLGERLLFTESSKNLGIYNGDFGNLVKISSKELTVKLDRNKEIIRFNPKEFGGFTYGYASTVYKTQGATFKGVYVFHNGYGNRKNSYVALTRHRESVRLYCNDEATKDTRDLAFQLGGDKEICLNNRYRVGKLFEESIKNLERKDSRIARYSIGALKGIRRVRNWYSDNFKVANAEIFKPKEERVLESKVLEPRKDVDKEKVSLVHEQGKSISIEGKEKVISIGIEEKKRASRIDLKELRKVREFVKEQAVEISRSVLGEENKRLSDKAVLRFGEKGKVAVNLEGEKRGLWYDFSRSEGGDLINLVQRQRGLNFQETIKYLERNYGIFEQKLVKNENFVNKFKEREENSRKEQKLEKRQEQRIEQRYKSTKELNFIGKGYFRGRGINIVESRDIRIGRNYDSERQRYCPSIVVFARNKSGKITGGQSIYLDISNKGDVSKADILVNKRSFGKIKGSFVDLNRQGVREKSKETGLTLISEGIENGLSIKESGIKGRIIASLGISNMKNYEADRGERIILICDHDRENKTKEIMLKAKGNLEKRGAIVELAIPKRVGDYNDMLRQERKEEIYKDVSQKVKRVVELSQVEIRLNKILVDNPKIKQDILKINPEYSFKELRMSLTRGGRYEGKDLNFVIKREREREFFKHSRDLIRENRNLLRGESIVNMGDVVLKEWEIRQKLASDYPELSRNVSKIKLDRREIEDLTNKIGRYVDRSEQHKEIAIEILESRGIESLKKGVNKLCKDAVKEKVMRDLSLLEGKGENRELEIRDFEGRIVKEKELYIDRLLQDKEIKSMLENEKIMDVLERTKQHTLTLSR